MTEKVVPVETDWKGMSLAKRKKAVGERWSTFQRRTVTEAWDIGRGLRATKDNMNHGEWMPWLEEIGMNTNMSARFMRVADGFQICDLDKFSSLDAALKALPPAHPKPEDAAPKQQKTPAPEADTEPEKAAEEVAHEAEAEQAAARKEAMDERLAIRLEGSDLEAVDELNRQVDAAEKRAEENRETSEKNRKRAMSEATKNRKVRDALLAVPRTGDAQTSIDDILAKFWNVARKTDG